MLQEMSKRLLLIITITTSECVLNKNCEFDWWTCKEIRCKLCYFILHISIHH